jgi:2-oxoglutarate ferredoxin oxidoreductase subunit alpha
MAGKASKIIVLENNLGQLLPFIKAECAQRAEVAFLPPALLGQIHDPEDILKKIREILP